MRLLSVLMACVFCVVSAGGAGRSVRVGSRFAQKLAARARARTAVKALPGDSPSKSDPIDDTAFESALNAEDDTLEREFAISPLLPVRALLRVDRPSVLNTLPRSHLPTVGASGSPLRC